jgi:gluconolactonase
MQITRRNVLVSGAAAAVTALTTKVTFGGWEPSERYPDPAIKILDPSFTKYRVVQATVERLYTGARFGEGPVWFGDARCLLWSDIPNDRILRWDEETGHTALFRKPSNYSNGNTRDRQGRLVTCEHDARRVTRTEHDGTITVLIDKFDGKSLNSPNDVVVKSDGAIWFTDPLYGILGNVLGHVAQQELPCRSAKWSCRRGGRRYQAERTVLFARREEDVPRRRQRPCQHDPGLRCRQRRHRT